MKLILLYHNFLVFVLYFCVAYQNWVMASLWHSFVEAVTPGYDLPGQGEGGHHNHMVGGCPLSHKPVRSHVMGTHSRSSSNHRGVPGDPNVTQRKLLTTVRVEESGSKDEEEFEDSRKNLPPRHPIGHSSSQEQAPLPQSSTSWHLANSSGVRVVNGKHIVKGLWMISSRILSFIRMQPLIIKMHMKLYMPSRSSFKVGTMLKHLYLGGFSSC